MNASIVPNSCPWIPRNAVLAIDVHFGKAALLRTFEQSTTAWGGSRLWSGSVRRPFRPAVRTSVQDAANGGFEPKVPYAATCTDGNNGPEAVHHMVALRSQLSGPTGLSNLTIVCML